MYCFAPGIQTKLLKTHPIPVGTVVLVLGDENSEYCLAVHEGLLCSLDVEGLEEVDW